MKNAEEPNQVKKDIQNVFLLPKPLVLLRSNESQLFAESEQQAIQEVSQLMFAPL